MRIYINEDNDHYFKLDQSLMAEPALRQYIDKYADYGVSVMVFCTSGQRTSYRSEVMDAIWDPMNDGPLPAAAWVNNAKKLFDEGIDPYQIWLDQCRRRGMKCWISTRMNDMHHTHPSLRYRGDRRWFEHPEWTLEPERFSLPSGQSWEYYQDLQSRLAWNYARPEVRSLMLALLVENVRRYDADAYELDFSRDFFCLPVPCSASDKESLTDLMRTFRKEVDESSRGRRSKSQIAVRLPWTPELAEAWGYDVKKWGDEQLIDIVIASPWWRSFQYDFSLEHWQKSVGKRVSVIPSVDFWISPGPDLPLEHMTAEFLRGWCRNQEAQGADSVYFFNFPYWIQTKDNDPAEAEKLRTLAGRGLPSIARQNGMFRYQIGYQDLPFPGETCSGILPLELNGSPAEFTLLIRNRPDAGSVFAVPVLEVPDENVRIEINGKTAGPDGAFDPSGLCDGENKISVTANQNRLLNFYLQWNREENGAEL